MARPRSPSRSRRSKTLFADTAFWVALLSERDQHGAAALRWKGWIGRRAPLVVTTEAVLWELLNGLSSPSHRSKAAQVYRQCHAGGPVEVVPFDETLRAAAFDLYEAHADKGWSLTDCLSFRLMRDRGLTDALTTDHHFEQAGFRALLLEDPPQ